MPKANKDDFEEEFDQAEKIYSKKIKF